MKLILSLLLMSFSHSLFSYEADVNVINRKIKENKLSWFARDNKFSNISDYELKKLLGSNEMPAGDLLIEERKLSKEILDWRNVNGINWLGRVLNQGNCGSCVAFASIATLEARMRINSGLEWLSPTLSPQYLFSCGGGLCNFGWQPLYAAYMLKSDGVVDSSCAPYESGSTGEDVSCKSLTCENKVNRIFKIADFKKPSTFGGTMEKIKAALKEGPLLTTMTVYEDFLSYGGGIYKSISRKKAGGHAISLVGFNDVERYWIIKNSWGDDWGENGYARVSYDDKSGVAESTFAFLLNKEDQYVDIIAPNEHDYLNGVAQFKVKLKNYENSQIEIRGESDKLSINSCDSTKNLECIVTLDTTKLKDGRYEIIAKTSSNHSQVHEFYVSNSKPNIEVTFSAPITTDLKKPIFDRIELNIDIKSDSVKPKTVVFEVLDQNNKLVLKRSTDDVFNSMKLGFRTTVLPNGKYTIYYKALTPYNGGVDEVYSNKELVIIKN